MKSWAIGLLLTLVYGGAWADDLASVREKAAICDPNAPSACARPQADGSLVAAPPTAASGKTKVTSTPVPANTSTQIAAANTSRIAMGIQCGGAAAVNLSETGATLASASFGAAGATYQLPANASAAPYFSPPIASLTAITAYTGTAQVCVVTEYQR